MSYVGLPFQIIGVVKSTDGPVAGARVFATDTAERIETWTDANGFFRLLLPSLGSGHEPDSAWFSGYRFGIEAQGMIPEFVRTRLPIPAPHPSRIGTLGSFHLNHHAADLTGVVRDLAGTPVADAHVKFTELWGTTEQGVQETRSGSDGRFGPLAVPAGYGKLVATGPGQRGDLRFLVLPGPPEIREVSVTVEPHEREDEWTVAARIEQSDGSPAAGYRLEDGSRTAFTDEEGRFEFACPQRPEGPLNVITDELGRVAAPLPIQMPLGFELRLLRAGYWSMNTAHWPVDKEAPRFEFELTPCSSTVRLRAVDAQGRPLVGAITSYGGLDDTWLTDDRGVAVYRTGARRFRQIEVRYEGRMGSIPPPGYSLFQHVRNLLAGLGLGFESRIPTTAQIASGTLTLRPAPLPTTGRIVGASFKEVYGRGVHDADLETPPATTDALGRFTLHGLPVGEPAQLFLTSRYTNAGAVGETRGGDADVVIELPVK